MYIAIDIVNQDSSYKVCKLFQNRVRHLSNFLIKTIGVNHVEKKAHAKKIKEGKRPGRSMKATVYNHMLRKMKSKLNTKTVSHENTTAT
jgi:hypothetical protein